MRCYVLARYALVLGRRASQYPLPRAVGKPYRIPEGSPEHIIMAQDVINYDPVDQADELLKVCEAHRKCYEKSLSSQRDPYHFEQAMIGLRQLILEKDRHSITNAQISTELKAWYQVVPLNSVEARCLKAMETKPEEAQISDDREHTLARS